MCFGNYEAMYCRGCGSQFHVLPYPFSEDGTAHLNLCDTAANADPPVFNSCGTYVDGEGQIVRHTWGSRNQICQWCRTNLPANVADWGPYRRTFAYYGRENDPPTHGTAPKTGGVNL